jgi:hypothetical protein
MHGICPQNEALEYLFEKLPSDTTFAGVKK